MWNELLLVGLLQDKVRVLLDIEPELQHCQFISWLQEEIRLGFQPKYWLGDITHKIMDLQVLDNKQAAYIKSYE